MADLVQQQGKNFEDAPLSSVHYKVAAGAYMGIVTDGYTLGIVGIALSYAVVPLGLSAFWMGMIGAASMVGLLLGSFGAGVIADRVGRRPLFAILMLLSVFMSVIQFFISDPLYLTITRFILGMLIGADYTVAIPMLSEWMPAKKRPRSLAILIVFWAVGYSTSYIVGFFMDGLGDDGWRWVLATPAIPAIIAFIIRIGTPESPKWLAAKGRSEDATAIANKYLGPDYYMPIEEKAATGSWFALFAPDQWRKTVVSGWFFFAQVLPFYGVSLFLPIVLTQMNIENPNAAGILYHVFTIIGVLVGTWLVDVVGRRPFIIGTFYIAAALLAALAIWQTMPGMLALTLITALSLVMAIFIIPEFVYPPELFPTEIRSSGVGLTIAISRLGAASGAFMLPVITEAYGLYTVFWICVGVLISGGLLCQMWAPETSPKFMKNKEA